MSGRGFFSHFEEDPFFGLPRGQFSSFDHFFNNHPFRPAVEGPQYRERAVDRFNNRRSHFGHCHDMFPSFDRAFRRMDQDVVGNQEDPDAHSYSHSSVMTYSTGEEGRPKYYEASSSTRKAPGGIRETRKTVRDSERELSKMAIGRHIGDRGHLVEKSENTRTGLRDEKQDFLGIDQKDLGAFDRDWSDRARAFHQGALAGASEQPAMAIDDAQRK